MIKYQEEMETSVMAVTRQVRTIFCLFICYYYYFFYFFIIIIIVGRVVGS